MSPELFSESSYDSKSDIWALGCVIYEMVALQYVVRGPPLLDNDKRQTR
jgi:serine/threonine protein kinase